MEPHQKEVESEDVEVLLPKYQPSNEFSQKHKRKCSSWAQVTALTAFIAFVTLVTLSSLIYYSTPHQHLKHCGGLSPEEREQLCKFDIMSFSWLPPPCFDQELVDEFNAIKEWGYWEHKFGAGGRVSYEEANRGLRDLFVSWDHHKHHCFFMVKKLHRAVVSGRPVDSYVGNYGHTKHCEKMLFSNETSELAITLINSPILIKTPYCGLENWNNPPLDIEQE